MPVYTTEGIILKSKKFGEADRILTIFTRHQGKVSAIAKGVRRITSRKGGNADLLNHTRFSLATGKNLDIVTEAEAITSFPNIKNKLRYTALAFRVVELVDKFFMESQENIRVFRRLVMTLGRLDSKDLETTDKMLVARHFEMHVLKEVGFDPELVRCVVCRNPVALRNIHFSPRYGGVACSRCKRSGTKISDAGLSVLVNLQNRSWEDIKRSRQKKPRVLREVEGVLGNYIEHILEKELSSKKLSAKIPALV